MPIGRRTHFFAGKKLSHQVIDDPLVVAAEFGATARANGFDGLAAQPGLAGEIEMGGPGVLRGGVASYQQHDQFDQALIEFGADAKTIRQPIGRLGDVRAVNPN